jgi:prepilin-type N-terminal cleavage/methylation domain-containing protein
MSQERQSARRQHDSQAGFTLIELLVATTLGVVILTALTSVVLTTYRADQTAIARTEVAGEIRNFQQYAYDDFVSSVAPSTPAGCGTAAQPCTDSQITLVGCLPSTNYSVPSVKRTVKYAWSSGTSSIVRTVHDPLHPKDTVVPAASNVTAFTWYIDSSNGTQSSVVVSLTVQIQSISQSQTMRFYPRSPLQMPVAPDGGHYVAAPC